MFGGELRDLVGRLEDHNLLMVSSSLSITLSILFVLFQFFSDVLIQ